MPELSVGEYILGKEPSGFLWYKASMGAGATGASYEERTISISTSSSTSDSTPAESAMRTKEISIAFRIVPKNKGDYQRQGGVEFARVRGSQSVVVCIAKYPGGRANSRFYRVLLKP